MTPKVKAQWLVANWLAAKSHLQQLQHYNKGWKQNYFQISFNSQNKKNIYRQLNISMPS